MNLKCKVSAISLKTVGPKRNVLPAVRTILTKDARIEKQENQSVPIVKGPHVASYKGCPEYKKQAFRHHVVNNQKTYAATVRQNTLPQPKENKTFTFTSKQVTKFMALMWSYT